MKSHESALFQVAGALLKDVRQAYPTLAGLDKDIQRLASLVKDRGIGLFTLDLPHLDQVLLHGLAHGWLPLGGPLTRAYSKKIRVPRLFAGLWLRVFDSSGTLLKEPDETAIFMLRQLACLGKKIETPCAPARFNRTIQEYIDIEAKIRKPDLQWEGDYRWLHVSDRPTTRFRDGLADFEFSSPRSGVTPEQRLDRLSGSISRLEHICDRVATGLGTFDPYLYTEELWDRGDRPGTRHGPGAVADMVGSAYKYAGFPNWSAKLQEVFPFDAFGVANPAVILQDNFEYPEETRVSSVLYAVPKTAKGPRLIAAEPMSNQWCQQLILKWLVEQMTRLFGDNFITIKDQIPSRAMAMTASMVGELATVDLSSASDRLSCWAIERMLRKNQPLLDAFHAVRTETVYIPYKGFDCVLPLRKFSTQGSALTFPVQSMFFLCCALACDEQTRSIKGYIAKHKTSVRVFGDDIIVPNTWYADLFDLLEYLGLKVNPEKSFFSGLFRESCGTDAFAGVNVTPIKPKSLKCDGPTSITSLIDTCNNFWLSGLWHASRAVESMIPAWVTKLLPLGLRDLAVEDIGVGSPALASFCGYSVQHLRSRMSSYLHRPEVRTLCIKSKSKPKQAEGAGRLLQYFTERPDFSTPSEWQGGMSSRPRLTMRSGWEPLVPKN